MITHVQLWWLEQEDGLCVGAHSIIDVLEMVCVYVCALTEVHALGCSVARRVAFGQLIVWIEACSQVLLLLKLTIKQQFLSPSVEKKPLPITDSSIKALLDQPFWETFKFV